MKKILIFLALLIAACLCSCRGHRQAVVAESRHIVAESDSLMRMIAAMMIHGKVSEELRSINMRESATYTLNEAGDTVKTIIERERDTSKESNVQTAFFMAYMDSLYRANSRTDSVYLEVPVPYEVVKEVNVLKWWQKFLLWSGIVAWAAVLVFLIGSRGSVILRSWFGKS